MVKQSRQALYRVRVDDFLSRLYNMEQVLSEQRLHIRNLLITIVQKYNHAEDVLKAFEANPELDVHMLASIMKTLAELEDELSEDEEVAVIFEQLEDINERVMAIAEDMKN